MKIGLRLLVGGLLCIGSLQVSAQDGDEVSDQLRAGRLAARQLT